MKVIVDLIIANLVLGFVFTIIYNCINSTKKNTYFISLLINIFPYIYILYIITMIIYNIYKYNKKNNYIIDEFNIIKDNNDIINSIKEIPIAIVIEPIEIIIVK